MKFGTLFSGGELAGVGIAAARLSVQVPYSVGDECGIHTAINRAYSILSYPTPAADHANSSGQGDLDLSGQSAAGVAHQVKA